MGKGPSLFRFDAFAKTLDDARVKTTSGGILTLICMFTILILLFNEYGDYKTIVIRPELVVDRDQDNKLDINLDITFPKMPCDMLAMDIMDLTGDIQVDLLNGGFTRIRLDQEGNEISEEEKFSVNKETLWVSDDPNYCGSCYGSIDQSNNDKESDLSKKVCCNTCEAVKAAYAAAGWKFYDGEGIDQCEKEGYVKRMNERLGEGCRIKGTAQLNRIGGNLHFAPGSSITMNDRHVHDLSLFDKHPEQFNFDHVINHFAFGPDDHHQTEALQTKSHSYITTHPLDGTRLSGDKYRLYSYFLKVVNTRFEYLDGEVLETNEFSATQHDRPLRGGRDDDHPNTIHARGGIPGVFFYFDISPMKIINREEHKKTWSAFVLSVCSAIAGVLTVFSVLDKTIWAAHKLLKEKKVN
ncbi:DEKNAAC103432 [Brettanomyces naardenensis]|uniref:Endoplasmic reticulum-Golgi intermediate compartment protein n=1 Tax=Brettanomyces naardenensis TaxID=13370 RepID=A0A448YNY3_BRENA|nr:DEKNAAC103432 [Brettanomyces naardenensis]